MRVRAYRWWLISQVLSASGGITQAVAQSWLVLHLTHSAFLLALTTTATFTPLLLGSAWAGSLVDRFDRRKVLVGTQSVYIVLGVALGALVVTGSVRVWMLFAFAFANGCISAIDAPTRQVFVLELVGTDCVASAIGLNEVVINASRVLGPAVGGALLATVGFAACFFVNAASYLPPLGVVVALLWRRGWAHTQATEEERGPGRVRKGLAFAWSNPAIRYSMLMAVAAGMLFNMGATLPLMATRAFRAGAGGYGAMMATFGGGGSFRSSRSQRRTGLAKRAPSPPARRTDRGGGLPRRRLARYWIAFCRPRVGRLRVDLVYRARQRPRPVEYRARAQGPRDGGVDNVPTWLDACHEPPRGWCGDLGGRKCRSPGRVRPVGGGAGPYGRPRLAIAFGQRRTGAARGARRHGRGGRRLCRLRRLIFGAPGRVESQVVREQRLVFGEDAYLYDQARPG